MVKSASGSLREGRMLFNMWGVRIVRVVVEGCAVAGVVAGDEMEKDK